MLDAILSPDWEYRYYSSNSRWAEGELLASMRNGQGDHWFLLFSPHGVVLHGLAHEAPMYRPNAPWPGIFDQLPLELAGFLSEPAFDTRNSTFCVWRRLQDDDWHRGNITFPPAEDPDGSEDLLRLLDGRPESYRSFAESYYGTNIPLTAIEAIYRHEPLQSDLLRQLNPALDLDSLRDDEEEIGYPEPASPVQPT